MSTLSAPKFGKFRSFLWPVYRFELPKFLPLLLMYSLICFNYSLLRAAKDALVITAPSSGAEALPFIKVWAILPMAILITVLFSKLINRYSQQKVFYIMVGIFISFFLVFITVLYPLRDFLHPHETCDKLQLLLPQGFKGLITLFRNWTFTLFYVMSELWGTTIMTILFWGFANRITSVKDAKRYYAIFGVGANLATIFAGQMTISFATKNMKWASCFGCDHWAQCLGVITSSVILVGVAILFIFKWYTTKVLSPDEMAKSSSKSSKTPGKKKKQGLRKSFDYLLKSKYLICIAVIVISFNVAINMIEIVWKDQLKLLYPDPAHFNAYMGRILVATGILSTLIGLLFCGNVIRRLGWTFGAMITPIIIAVTSAGFFGILLAQKWIEWPMILGMSPIVLSTLFGAIQNSLSRASKYTLFDATKEIALIPLDYSTQLKGKAAIDGVGSRLGKSGGSLLHQGLLLAFGSVALSTPYVAVLLFVVLGGWMVAVKSLGKQFKTLSEEQETASTADESVPATPAAAKEELEEVLV